MATVSLTKQLERELALRLILFFLTTVAPPRQLTTVLHSVVVYVHYIYICVYMCVSRACRLQRSNLTELLVAALADGAYCAAPDRLPGARVTCLAALSGSLRRLHARCVADASLHVSTNAATGDGNSSTADVNDVDLGRGGGGGAGSATTSDSGDQVGSWATAAEGVSSTSMSASDAPATATAETGLPSPSSCREQRKRKRVLELAAAAFREKPREGLKLLQMEGVFSPGLPLDAREVASFLRTAPGLDKATVGSYLGEAGAKGAPAVGGVGTKATVLQGGEERARSSFPGSVSSVAAEADGVSGGGRVVQGRGRAEVYRGDTVEFHAEVLEAFVETFDFRGQGLLASLRMFLEAFRLPGEAQQIDRILHVSIFCGVGGWGNGGGEGGEVVILRVRGRCGW